jgi:transcriptional regulator with XRE-family HTH domain
MITFSKTLKLLRLHKGLTQKELARHLHLSSGTISNYENGVHEPDYDTLIRISEFFDVSPGFLLGIDIPNGILSTDIYNGYCAGNIFYLLPFLNDADRAGIVNHFRLLEELRIPWKK